MATKKEQAKVAETTEIKKLNRGLTPLEMVKSAFEVDDKSEKKDENIGKMPYFLGIQTEREDYSCAYLVEGIRKYFKEVDADKPDYDNANYADAALLAKAVATCQREYVNAMAVIIKEMVKQTLAAVKAGYYKPLVKVNGNVEKCSEPTYIDRFISRASLVLKSDVQTIVSKGPYFVFGWVDDQSE